MLRAGHGLPALHAHELSPEEPCKNCMKLEMVNLVPHGDADLRATTRVGFQRLGRKPQLSREPSATVFPNGFIQP
jgi:hypothetical protein